VNDEELTAAIDQAVVATQQAERRQAQLLRERALRRIEELFPGAHLIKTIGDYDEFHNLSITVHEVRGAEGQVLFDSDVDDEDALTPTEDDLEDYVKLAGEAGKHVLNVVAIRLDQDRITDGTPDTLPSSAGALTALQQALNRRVDHNLAAYHNEGNDRLLLRDAQGKTVAELRFDSGEFWLPVTSWRMHWNRGVDQVADSILTCLHATGS
jgi:hypothetical protein